MRAEARSAVGLTWPPIGASATKNRRAPLSYTEVMLDSSIPKDYSNKQLDSTDLRRHCHINVYLQSGDEVWIGDVRDGADPIVTLCIKNISFSGAQSQVDALIGSAGELLDDLRREPELANRLLPRILRRDPVGTRTTPHPLYRKIA